MCTPANVTSEMVTSLNPGCSEILAKIPYVDVAVVNIEYDTKVGFHGEITGHELVHARNIFPNCLHP